MAVISSDKHALHQAIVPLPSSVTLSLVAYSERTLGLIPSDNIGHDRSSAVCAPLPRRPTRNSARSNVVAQQTLNAPWPGSPQPARGSTFKHWDKLSTAPPMPRTLVDCRPLPPGELIHGIFDANSSDNCSQREPPGSVSPTTLAENYTSLDVTSVNGRSRWLGEGPAGVSEVEIWRGATRRRLAWSPDLQHRVRHEYITEGISSPTISHDPVSSSARTT